MESGVLFAERPEWPERFAATMGELRSARREADREVLREARAVELLARGGHRELGHALLGDLLEKVGLGSRRGMMLADLGRAIAAHPDLEARILSDEIPLEKAEVAARGIARTKRGYLDWRWDLERKSVEELRGLVDSWTRTRESDCGKILRSERLPFTKIGRSMLADAEMRLSERGGRIEGHGTGERGAGRIEGRERPGMRERRPAREDGAPPPPVKRHEVLLRAIEEAISRVRKGAPLGVRRYRRVKHTEESLSLVVAQVGAEVVFVRHENPHWELVKDPIPPEGLDRLIERIRDRHGMDEEESDRLAIARRALDRGIQAWEARPLAEAVLGELRKAVADEGGSWFRVCEALACLEALGFRGWEGLGAAVLRRSASTTSELLSCGKACRRFPELDRAFRAGEVSWTKVRTLAPRLDPQNFERLYPMLAKCSVRELEEIRAALQRKARRGPAGPREQRFPVEMETEGWDRLEDLRVELFWRTKRHWKKEEALEEALWQALTAWGSPSPLWRSYRVTVHVDPATDIHWVRGPGELLALSREEVDRIREADTVEFDLGEALARAAEREEESAREQVRVPEWRPGGRGIPLAGVVSHGDRAPPPEVWLKRLVYLRHSGMCSSPGCGATLYLDVHHHVERRRGGGNHPENLGLECTRCHATTHSKSGRVVLRAASRAFHLFL